MADHQVKKRSAILLGIGLLIVGVVTTSFVVRRVIKHHSPSTMRLNIKLPKGWEEYNNPDGPPTFCRELSEVPGPLQISWAEYNGGPVPNPSADDLKRMSSEFGKKQGWGELVESSSGSCEFGIMGTAVFRSTEYPRIQMWHLSNGKDFIMVTHICPKAPDQVEVREAQEIVRTLTLRPPIPH